jgi:hypothetical protein
LEALNALSSVGSSTDAAQSLVSLRVTTDVDAATGPSGPNEFAIGISVSGFQCVN